MKVSDLLNSNSNLNVSGLTLNSNEVVDGSVFIALEGTSHHGLNYAKSAVEKGAIAILFDSEDIKLADKILADLNVLKIPVADLAKNLGNIAARFYDEPSHKINVIGITGTNGKTSCSQFLAQSLENCGVIGTLGWGKFGQLKQTLNTTPDALAVQKMLATLKNEGCENVAMEVSSHGLAQGRVNGLKFKGAIFTNFSRDHLDYHGTIEAYLETKLTLFHAPQLEFAVINLDDEISEKILAAIPENVEIISVTTQAKQSSRGQTLSTENIELNLSGIQCDVFWHNQKCALHVPLIGLFNLENVLCVLAVILKSGVELEEAAKRLTNLKPVNGRMERFGGDNNQPLVIVDYAHTPDALEKVLRTLRSHTKGKLGVVFGCGGNRDSGKRSQMGRVAEQFADSVIITDDNPRFESNQEIAKDILSGFFNHEANIIHDRANAIRHAIELATAQDCVLIAGKGHENYQEINGIKFPFNDAECVRQIMVQA
ncbi:MAG: UDP-N-acetylmuramoyl-L-alanyl-D-glutamate--2,6-diaminopimelate ligase [Methylococcales bacterium]|nr:UDP-N-acetylmuramoyl-L-alanyl-D-glutamate--2,6-diaminopimelate ligase [Methylococcales bacterium]